MPANAVPLGVPLAPLMAIPEGIDITEPSGIAIIAFIAAELLGIVEVEDSDPALGLLFHSIVIGARDGVAMGTMLGAEVMLERCASAKGATVRRA
jgi:hypothetical protein